MKTQTIEYFHRGKVERGTGQGYEWREGYSANSANGKPTSPWMTRFECMADAKKRGCKAVFHYNLGQSTKESPRPMQTTMPL
jgi:hypothetical protein